MPEGGEGALKKRFTDFKYVLTLVCADTGHGYKGTDCTCGKCKQLFKENPLYIDHIRSGLECNWGTNVNRKDRRINLLQDILVGQTFDESGNLKQHWFIQGHKVCYSFYLAARGYSHKFVCSYRNKLKKSPVSLGGVVDYAQTDGNSYKNEQSPKKDHFIAWLQHFAETVGDYMPTEQAIVLPYPKFEGVHLEYKQEMQRRNEAHCCYSYACRLFSEEISNIKLVRSKGNFVCCKVCTSYQHRILKAKSQEERQQLKLLRLKHVEKQRLERIYYYTHREAAKSSPDHILSIIMDGMDQSKTNIPLYSRRTSDRVIGIRLVGVKVHGIGDYVYLVDTTVKGGANLMIEILRLTLLDLEKMGKLPSNNPILYLQLDNCSENKNRVLFAFLSDLVERKVFDKVYAGFLMVGHTHEDIDQFFSVIASWLKKFETICPDIESLKQAIKAAFLSKGKDPPTVAHLHAPEVYDYDSFYLPSLNPKLAHHSLPHQFRFQCFENAVLCHYKMWSTHPKWLPELEPSISVESLPNDVRDKTSKKRTHIRGAAKRNLKKQKVVEIDSSDSDDATLNTAEKEPNSHPLYDEVYENEACPPQGVKWLTIPMKESSVPARVSISLEKSHKNWADSQGMYNYVLNKCRPINPAIFTENVLSNWLAWIQHEEQIWCSSTEFVSSLVPFSWPSTWKSRSKQSTCELVVQTEQKDCEPNKEILFHDSGKHGCFSKSDQVAVQKERSASQMVLLQTEIVTGLACIYKWKDNKPDGEVATDPEQCLEVQGDMEEMSQSESDDEGEAYLWLGIVVSVVEGSPEDENCKLLVRWCPNEKKRNPTWRTKLSHNDTFDLTYSSRLRQAPYRSVISKRSCIAVNLKLTASGKLDNKFRFDDGSTSKEVAKSAVEEFYALL